MAKALGDLNEQVVYVGGAMVSLYIDDPAAEDTVICRFRYDDLKVDVMATEEIGWAPSNPWFKEGFERAIPVQVDDSAIRILPLSYFLATKLDAFFDRGIQDVYASHDLEDLVYLFNYTTTIASQVLESDPAVTIYIQESLRKLLDDKKVISAMEGHLYYEQAAERMEVIKERMRGILTN